MPPPPPSAPAANVDEILDESKFVDLYTVLGVSADATEAQLKRAYRLRSLKYHPDKKTGSTLAFQRVREAFDTLSDPAKRRAHDPVWKSTSELGFETTRSRGRRRVDGVGRPKFDFHTGMILVTTSRSPRTTRTRRSTPTTSMPNPRCARRSNGSTGRKGTSSCRSGTHLYKNGNSGRGARAPRIARSSRIARSLRSFSR